jgi:hypothetical protein
LFFFCGVRGKLAFNCALELSDMKSETGLRKHSLGVSHIVFFVIAAAAPLTAVVGVTPAAFILGNGP